jgi:fumarate reductase subunit D
MPSSLNQTDASRPVDPEIQDGKFFAAIGYLNVLCFVPIYLKKGNKFAQFHGKQALVLFILEIAAGIISIVPAIGDLISRFAFVIFGILSLIGIIKVLMEEYWEMPVIYEISTRINP